MGLFDIVRDKAAELFSGASEKVTDLTGVELPGAETAENLPDAAQALGDTATGAAENVAGTVSDAANDAIADVTDPPKPE